MDSNGGVFKRCGCRDPHSGRLLGTGCPTLAQRGHGSWYFDCAVARFQGRRERIRRGGYPTRREALAARDALLRPGLDGGTTQGWTVARWLRFWLISRTSIRPSTLRSYHHHVDAHLIPHLGRLQLDELTGRHVATMFRTLAATPTGRGRPPTPGTLHRIRATLRAALNAAVREGLRSDNPARHVELPGPRRPHAEVWTNQQITAWREQGQRPIVAVWTAQQLAAFLATITDDRLYPMWWLIALRGLRRGEAAGLRWCDLDLHAGTLTIAQQRIAYGTTVHVGPPKTAASRRSIALDHATVRLLREHRRHQQTERDAAGDRWQDSGYLFTTADGSPLHPDWLTRRFRRLVTASGLPPVRLHDLRHGAASVALAAGADLKTVQAMLGHASIVLTADTYTSVLPELLADAAEATARLVLAHAARRPPTRPQTPSPRSRWPSEVRGSRSGPAAGTQAAQ
ncbi:MAG TPA: tyrosine-type recombinase/integrase, partial [Streptosporangiaceae bacterium]